MRAPAAGCGGGAAGSHRTERSGHGRHGTAPCDPQVGGIRRHCGEKPRDNAAAKGKVLKPGLEFAGYVIVFTTFPASEFGCSPDFGRVLL